MNARPHNWYLEFKEKEDRAKEERRAKQKAKSDEPVDTKTKA